MTPGYDTDSSAPGACAAHDGSNGRDEWLVVGVVNLIFIVSVCSLAKSSEAGHILI